ncbi:MAG: hypothetical protein QM802_08355 [Agriterribacter sp.]
MVKYVNSPLKITGTLLAIAGAAISAFSFGQFLFLGVSVIALGVIIHVTAAILFKSEMRAIFKKAFEFALVLFIFFFCAILLMDYWGIMKINL